MLMLRNLLLAVSCYLAVMLLEVAQFSIETNAAPTSCPFIHGTKADDSAPCLVAPDILIKEASKRILEKIDKREAPTPDEIAALKTLVSVAQRWLLRDPSGEFPKNRLMAQADALAETVVIYPRDFLVQQARADVDTKIREVVPKLFGWTGGSPSGAFAEYAKGLNTYLTEDAAKEAAKLAFRSGLPKEFSTLIATTLELGAPNTTSTLISASETLSAFIEKNKASVDAGSDVLIGRTRDLITQLQAIEAAGERPAPTVLRRSLALKSELAKALETAEDKKKSALAIRQALFRADVTAELVNVREQIRTLTAPLEPKIHIIGAWYGHLGQKWSEGSHCSATSAMRNYCERKSDCSAGTPGNANGSPLDPIQLCGADPAPLARGLARGLTVDYSCETGNDEFWAALAKDPLTHPNGEEYSRSNSIRAVLRSPAMTLNCAFPPR